MKRKYAVFIILFALPLLDVFYACCTCNYETEKKRYINSGFSITNIDNSGETAIESSAENINKKAYGIRLKINRESLTFHKKHTTQYLFTSSAYAMSCDCPPTISYSPYDTIQSIKIITLQNFNNDKPANTEITEYFKTPRKYLDVSETIDNLNKTFNETLKENEEIDYLLMEFPSDENVQHQFRVIITFENKPAVELITTINLI